MQHCPIFSHLRRIGVGSIWSRPFRHPLPKTFKGLVFGPAHFFARFPCLAIGIALRPRSACENARCLRTRQPLSRFDHASCISRKERAPRHRSLCPSSCAIPASPEADGNAGFSAPERLVACHATAGKFFAFAAKRVRDHKDRAFQASSPKTFQGWSSDRPFLFAPVPRVRKRSKCTTGGARSFVLAMRHGRILANLHSRPRRHR
ncbi:hypothetical protein EDF59_109168 [Novosphingobium sp. ST904]|nr:hypothetical protein EDF59_109168 [Novosphingobium sp. ST904]